MEAQLKLKEIIWEITPECHNNCKYCGSREILNDKTLPKNDLLKIADKICEYPPQEIDISGGDPLLIPYSTHSEIIQKFKRKNIKSKILVNPKSINDNKKRLILGLYDWIGISVNSVEELNVLKEKKLVNDNITIITNFNIINLYDYENIESYVKYKNCNWMIQFTVYKNDKSELAIYNNENSLGLISDKVSKSIYDGVKILISDNANKLLCGMGKSIIGILYNGDVVPCLSMRAWVDNIKEKVQGNILKNSLMDIWENKFKNYRFKDFVCCKDKCKNKIIKQTLSFKKFLIDKDGIDKTELPNPYTIPQSPNDFQIMMYGVHMGGNISYNIGNTKNES